MKVKKDFDHVLELIWYIDKYRAPALISFHINSILINAYIICMIQNQNVEKCAEDSTTVAYHAE